MWHTVEFSRFGRAPYLTLAGLIWGNRSNLHHRYSSVDQPCRRVASLKRASTIQPSARQSEPISIVMEGGYLVEFAGPFQSLRVSPSAATRKTLRAGYTRGQIA